MDRGLTARSFGAQVIDIDGQDGGVHRWAAGTPPVQGTVSVLADLSAHEAYVDRGLTARSFGAREVDIDGQDGGVHRWAAGTPPVLEPQVWSASSLT